MWNLYMCYVCASSCQDCTPHSVSQARPCATIMVRQLESACFCWREGGTLCQHSTYPQPQLLACCAVCLLQELTLLQGKHTNEFAALLGYATDGELIHRGNLALLLAGVCHHPTILHSHPT